MSDKLKIITESPVLKEGSRYIRRDGTITEPLVWDDYYSIVLMDPETGTLYDPCDDTFGHLYNRCVELEHDYDLIAEWKE